MAAINTLYCERYGKVQEKCCAQVHVVYPTLCYLNSCSMLAAAITYIIAHYNPSVRIIDLTPLMDKSRENVVYPCTLCIQRCATLIAVVC